MIVNTVVESDRFELQITLLFMMAFILILALACIASHDPEIEIACDQFNENHHPLYSFQIEVGGNIKTKLCANATIGF